MTTWQYMTEEQVEKALMRRKGNLIHTETVRFCTISGDPGCLGWPDWHEADCIYVDEERQFCKCGDHDVYGEMYHAEGCPLYETNGKESNG